MKIVLKDILVYFVSFFCEDTENYNYSQTGVKVCLDKTTNVKNNCQKLSKLSKELTYQIIIGPSG